jgi:hypothetical protein
MAGPSPRPGPSAASVLLVLLVAAVVGFLGGAFLALVGDSGDDGATPTPGPATASPGVTATAVPGQAAALTLTSDRQQASTEDLIRLSGRLDPAQAGVTLQVQQAVDGADFVDFPVTATTRSDGTYGVWVRTGREGRNQFRVVTTVEGASVASAPVVVVIG